MTVTTTNSFVRFRGTGLLTQFPYNFIIPDAATTKITIEDYETGVVVDTLDPTDYAITGLGVPTGGEVTYNPAGVPLSDAFNIVIERNVPITQTLHIKNQATYYPDRLEAELDLMVMMVQQVYNRLIDYADDVAGVIPLINGLEEAVAAAEAAATVSTNAAGVSVGAANSVSALANGIAGGTTGQLLAKTSNANYAYTWITPAGGGDMFKATYDSGNKAANVYNQDNMVNGTTNFNYTATERTKLTGIATGATQNATDTLLRRMVANPKTGAYVLLAADTNGFVPNTTGGWTLPSAVLSSGDAVLLYNDSASPQTITRGSGLTLYREGARTNTASFTLAAGGSATIVYISASVAYIIGGSSLT